MHAFRSRFALVGAKKMRLEPLPQLAEGIGRWSVIIIFFASAAVLQTWPLVLHACDSISNWPFRPEDSWMNLWNLSWARQSILDFENPFHTDVLFYPQGSDLYLHTLSLVNGVLSIPLQLLTGNVILSWNILALILFVLSGAATYALAYRVTGNRAAALIAGYIFAFSPFVLMRFHGHWNISTVWVIPLFALFALRYRDSYRLKDALGAGACWALIAYNNLEYAIDAGLFLGLFLAYHSLVSLREKDSIALLGLWRGVLVIGVSAFVIAAPLLIPAFRTIGRGDVSRPPVGAESTSTDLAALVTPSPLWGGGKVPAPVPDGSHHFPAGDIENTVYLGITPLILAGVAVAAIRRPAQPAVFWGAVFLVFVSLALGPHLFVGDTKDFSLAGVSFTIPMPYQLYEKIPVISDRRGISRMIIFAHLALSILAAVGLCVVSSLLKGKYCGLAPLIALIVLSLVVLEYWNPPGIITKLETPAALEAIRSERGDFAVLDAPLGRATWTLSGTQGGALLADYYQRIYLKPTFGGYLSRAPDSTVFWIKDQPGIKYLSCPACPGLPDQDDLNATTVKALFREYRVRYVVLHFISPHGFQVGGNELKALDGYLRSTLDLAVVYSDSSFTLYRNDDVKSQ